MIAELIPLDGTRPIPISRDITLVGRKRGLCDIVIDHSSISKVHCALARTDGLLFLRDLGSTNGTRVNGQRVTRGALLPGDELSIANLKFRVHLGPGAPGIGPHEPTEAIRIPPEIQRRGGSAPAERGGRDDERRTVPDSAEIAPVENFLDEGSDIQPKIDSRTVESDSDVRLLPIESHDLGR